MSTEINSSQEFFLSSLFAGYIFFWNQLTTSLNSRNRVSLLKLFWMYAICDLVVILRSIESVIQVQVQVYYFAIKYTKQEEVLNN